MAAVYAALGGPTGGVLCFRLVTHWLPILAAALLRHGDHLLALVGGQEHQPGCEPADRRLLAEAGVARPTVTVLLAATTPERRRAKVREARAYWPALGARVRSGFLGGSDDGERTLDALTDPDLVVLTGGRPWLLHRRLTGPVLDRVLDLWAPESRCRARLPRRWPCATGGSRSSLVACPRIVPGLGILRESARVVRGVVVGGLVRVHVAGEELRVGAGSMGHPFTGGLPRLAS